MKRALFLWLAIGVLLAALPAEAAVTIGSGWNRNYWLDGRYLGGVDAFGRGYYAQFDGLRRYGGEAYPWRAFDTRIYPGYYNTFRSYGFEPLPDYGRRNYLNNYVYNARYGYNVFSPRFGYGVISPRYSQYRPYN